MEISIYQAASGNLISVVIKLLEKIYFSGNRAIFLTPITERLDLINRTLWTYSKSAFIPHGDKSMSFEDEQPIYFTDVFKNPNRASVLILVDAFDVMNENYKNFERIVIIFEDILKADDINNIYRNLKDNGKNVNYWKQLSKGWEKLS